MKTIFNNIWKNKDSKEFYSKVESAFFGVAVGDALGVPVEFKSRETIKQNPVKEMIGYGTYYLPPGTWSDDSSLTFCLAEALAEDENLNLNTVSKNFINWLFESYCTARGEVFDVGNATRQAIIQLKNGVEPHLAGSCEASSNGNGSLMRILPLLFYIKDKPIDERYKITQQVSAITHGHIRSVIACFYYLEFARQILQGKEKQEIYKNLQSEVSDFLNFISLPQEEIKLFDRLLKYDIQNFTEEEIQSSGYVLHTLEASIWCLLNHDNYKDTVLKAVNLGQDTDTTSAVAGGLAGLLYGFENIPSDWIEKLARVDYIKGLSKRFTHSMNK